ncbi:class I SAM-dependent RNA methyltransferase [Rathayibacter rathayi]|uniref:Class I SAM-dependent RNA methyltransferase n=1 Tax=Rathayibacter rathayi TaxID=33887 RepID=A0ABD6WB37_RATRA|nr:class I SAM-dependent RNA methyltransferase [Rathayibacter rathayi]PPF15033.1 class I SAM-dependent RNA methyltransferase [Rathayibacter rathayi]PPF50328.1 class I SAM-dependent RNA methyltransferase [Rathayibacter rathayi]PPF81255.1 class I SAM-dependent RNA methyltransferase [Rathayibacter rathayi]PPG14051.1 class I SAM-dependent RNA methyltransferase [Rathayibacter rathayi]
MDLDISNVAHGGVFVARHEGRVVFVPDVLPGERVRARVSEVRHDSFWRAEALEVLEASEHRVEHVWPEADLDRRPEERVGGAEFGHADLAYQRELKRLVLVDSFARFARRDVAVEVSPIASDDAAGGLGWRTRNRLHVDDDGRVGPYAARSHHVVTVQSLPLATADSSLVAPLGERLAPGSVVDLVDAAGSEGAAVLVHDPADKRARRDRTVVSEFVAGRTFLVDRTGFWQVHRGAAAALFEAVQAAVDAESADPGAANHDLYGGVGLLAAALADRLGAGVRVTSVESDSRATEHALENLADQVGARAVTARVDRYLRDVLAQADARERSRWRAATVVLDPPRSGAGRAVTEALAELRPAQLVYVACDPVALARDVGALTAEGYDLAALDGFDLFPHTSHVEAVARLVRRGD